ncbi:hypothetical protein AYO20_04226 [Fonsecaea nubica]|uniref:Reverse transcriptase domain-containing protein n=1 Tax=Fonsecaea nubica TaxID=856822 RepID=A0A178D344_9EURO|nr:hypothetical protein AYO20_04226 [Fonsecaea nubica]OAL36610.1 hypothetical protein AYO20_04226 [Fonsecaea nubica]
MASSALPETLRSVTSTKIQEVRKQRDHFEASKKDIIREARPFKDDLERTRRLLVGSCRQAGITVVNDDSSDSDSESEPASDLARTRRNQQLFLRQAGKDPAFANEIVHRIHDELVEHLSLRSVQHEHAQFFSELVTEWLSSSTDVQTRPSKQNLMEESSFESVGRNEMHEQRAQWESIVFTDRETDDTAIGRYLHQLFNSDDEISKHFKNIETSTKAFCRTLRSTAELFSVDSLKVTITGLLRTDLLSDEKAAILKSFQNNPGVLQEVADVLNMRFASLESWKWTTIDGAIPIEQRRQLNGKYRVFMDEDVLDAILLHTIGIKWAVHFKSCLTEFFLSPAWRTAGGSIPKNDWDRRWYFLGEKSAPRYNSVEVQRKDQYGEEYFMSQLPTTESEGARVYNDDEGPFSNTPGVRDGISDDGLNSGTLKKGSVATKQGLLHLLITEALVSQHVRPGSSHAVIRSDFQWFGPSLPHNTIFAVLKFFGVGSTWLDFFRTFLQAPMRFEQDGPNGQYHVRQRGVPMSHALSDVFGEVILFAMDYAVNKATQTYLYRLHDDFWFWGTEEVCLRGWDAMSTFASVMGLEFNEEKTGSVVFDNRSVSRPINTQFLGSDQEMECESMAPQTLRLPKGDVRWGFLRLDANSVRFVIDQDMVDAHIKELQLQLSHCTSIFSYIQAYNAYLARFFSNNLGKPSFAFGRQHVDDMIDTFAKIQKALFPGGSVTDHLSSLAQERFGVKDIPDGVWYWPIQKGGLELHNPLVPLYCMRETMRQSPQTILSKCLEREEKSYLTAKAEFESEMKTHGRKTSYPSGLPTFGDQFMQKDEYLKYREQRSINLYNTYSHLLEVPAEFQVHGTNETTAWLDKLPSATRGQKSSSTGIVKAFDSMNAYWKWILAVYGSQIVEKYGSIQIVDAAQVPLGVVSVMKGGRVRWQG